MSVRSKGSCLKAAAAALVLVAGGAALGRQSAGAPMLPFLSLTARPGKWIDASLIQIKSDSAGDKVAYQTINNM